MRGKKGSTAVAPWAADAVERRPIADLTPYANNSRTHSDEQVAQIAASITEFGFTVPVLVDEDGGIIAGHGRVLAAASLGIDAVPVMVARGWTEAQKRAYVIADNKLALNAGWDEELLAAELEALKGMDFDLDLTGFGEDEIAKLLGEATEGDKPEDRPADESGINYQEQFGVIVICSSEANQEEVYNRLAEMGFNCKVVTT